MEEHPLMAYGQHRQLEGEIEKKVKAYATAAGVIARKWVSPGHRSVPDDIFLAPGGLVFFIEFKAPGKKPSQKQLLEHGELRIRGFKVFVVDNIGHGFDVIDQYSMKL